MQQRPPRPTASASAAARTRGAAARFQSFDALFEGAAQRAVYEKERYMALVEHIKNAVARENQRCPDSTFLKYHVIPLTFPGFNLHRCLDFVQRELTEFGFHVVVDEGRNDVFLYWGHIVPRHVREALREKRGVIVDEFGHLVGRELTAEQEAERKAAIDAANARTAAALRAQWEDAQFQQIQRRAAAVYDPAAVQSLQQLYGRGTPPPNPPR